MLLALACDPSGSDDEVMRLIDEVITIGNDNVAIVCDCWDEAGFASRSACLEDQILPSQRRCVEDAYLRDAEASELFLSCVTPILRELGECLDARLSCDEPDGTDACFGDYDLGRESCVQVPRSVERALEDCGVDDGGGSNASEGSATTDDTSDVPETSAGETSAGETSAGETGGPPPPDETASEGESTTDSTTDDTSATGGPAPPSGPCQWEYDGQCDEPEGTDVCPEGSDPADCA